MTKLHAIFRLSARLALVAGLSFGASSVAVAQQSGPLVVGLDFGVVPFGQINASGEKEGFSIDLAAALAERLGRSGAEVVDVEFSGMFAALFAERFEFIITPLYITEERAQQMLYAEPYFPADSGFIIAQDAIMSSLEDLQGKVVAVNNGTRHDGWATENAERYGFEVQRYSNVPETIQAVASGRAFTTVNQSPTMVYAASQNDRVKLGFIDYSGDNFGLAFRKEDVAYRNEVEEILECMKLDGSLQDLYRKWFASEPDPKTSLMAVYAGYGAPGFEGYEPTPHVPQCG
jgi:polar amino acid transport system substrate-binding protein